MDLSGGGNNPLCKAEQLVHVLYLSNVSPCDFKDSVISPVKHTSLLTSDKSLSPESIDLQSPSIDDAGVDR